MAILRSETAGSVLALDLLNIRGDTVSSLGHFNINNSPFRCPYVFTPFGVAGRGKASREIA